LSFTRTRLVSVLTGPVGRTASCTLAQHCSEDARATHRKERLTHQTVVGVPGRRTTSLHFALPGVH
jgi:hypothetical protein